jgi:hypothetical protein
MAKCPHCGYKLKLWDVRAECPKCKVNIPNYDWINRLEQDSVVAEADLLKIKNTFAKLKFAFVGTKLRIARIPISVLPLLSFLLPLYTLNFILPYFDAVKSFNIISLTKQVLGFDFVAIPGFISSPALGGAAIRFLLAILFVYLSALSLPAISLIFLIRNYKNLHSKGLFVTNLFAAILMISSAVLFSSFINLQQASTVNAFTGSVGFGLYIGIALFLASSAVNLAVAKSKVEMPETAADEKEEAVLKNEKESEEKEGNEKTSG